VSNFFPTFLSSHIIQGVITGAVLAFLTANVIMNFVIRSVSTKINGWTTTTQCGRPGNGILLRAACARILPGINVYEEAAYWTTTVDGSGQKLTGSNNYMLSFPAGQTPPNNAFWSLTITDVAGFMVSNPLDRYSVGDRSGLKSNTDGSISIHIQASVPAGHESNWLPTPAGKFKLTLRVYLPGPAILDGEYQVPPVMKVS
jgi:hypothetical protein